MTFLSHRGNEQFHLTALADSTCRKFRISQPNFVLHFLSCLVACKLRQTWCSSGASSDKVNYAVACDAKRALKLSTEWVSNSHLSSGESFKMCYKLHSDLEESFETLPQFAGEFWTHDRWMIFPVIQSESQWQFMSFGYELARHAPTFIAHNCTLVYELLVIDRHARHRSKHVTNLSCSTNSSPKHSPDSEEIFKLSRNFQFSPNLGDRQQGA